MKNEKILVVEDEGVIRKVLRLTLGKCGFQAEEAEDDPFANQRRIDIT